MEERWQDGATILISLLGILRQNCRKTGGNSVKGERVMPCSGLTIAADDDDDDEVHNQYPITHVAISP